MKSKVLNYLVVVILLLSVSRTLADIFEDRLADSFNKIKIKAEKGDAEC